LRQSAKRWVPSLGFKKKERRFKELAKLDQPEDAIKKKSTLSSLNLRAPFMKNCFSFSPFHPKVIDETFFLTQWKLVLFIPIYPQFSEHHTKLLFQLFQSVIKKYMKEPPILKCLPPFGLQSFFFATLADQVIREMQTSGRKDCQDQILYLITAPPYLERSSAFWEQAEKSGQAVQEILEKRLSKKLPCHYLATPWAFHPAGEHSIHPPSRWMKIGAKLENQKDWKSFLDKLAQKENQSKQSFDRWIVPLANVQNSLSLKGAHQTINQSLVDRQDPHLHWVPSVGLRDEFWGGLGEWVQERLPGLTKFK
jgi:hypothetical protein